MLKQSESGLPGVLDSLAFAREGSTVAGLVPVAKLSRLAESLCDDTGCLQCRIVGSRDAEGNSWLTMEVAGSLNLVCQRCLEPLAFPLQIQARFLLVPVGQSWPDEELAEDGFDAIAAEKEMAVFPLIEDEVMLALPIAPMHEVCATVVPEMKEQAPSPFAVLAKLNKS